MLPGCTYHLYNHANGRENLFSEPKNYDFFLQRLSQHVLPVARLFAYCLMPNHFHLLLSVRNREELLQYYERTDIEKKPEYRIIDVIQNSDPCRVEDILSKRVSRSFSNLFNSYAQAYNKMYKRRGSLFMPNMKRNEVNGDDSFCRVVHYIHTNPVHHLFVDAIDKWPHSSYRIFLSNGTTKLERDHVVDIFGGLDLFIKYHSQPIDPKYKWE